MEPVELFNSDGKSVGLFACGKCRRIPQGYIDEPKAPGALPPIGNCKALAEECCSPCVCERCKAEFKPEYGRRTEHCRDCGREIGNEQTREKRLQDLAKAEDITGQYDGPVLCEEVKGGDWEDYFSSVAALQEHVAESDEFYDENGNLIYRGELWSFVSTSYQLKIDIHQAIEQICENGYSNIGDFLEVPDYLKEAAEKFNKEYEKELTCWEVDYSRKVRIILPEKLPNPQPTKE